VYQGAHNEKGLKTEMTDINEYEIQCTCEFAFKANLYDSINIALNPEMIKVLYDGNFNVVECPKCHTRVFVDKWFLFHDMEKDIMVQIEEGDFSDFMNYLASKGYFDHFHGRARKKRGFAGDISSTG